MNNDFGSNLYRLQNYPHDIDVQHLIKEAYVLRNLDYCGDLERHNLLFSMAGVADYAFPTFSYADSTLSYEEFFDQILFPDALSARSGSSPPHRSDSDGEEEDDDFKAVVEGFSQLIAGADSTVRGLVKDSALLTNLTEGGSRLKANIMGQLPGSLEVKSWGQLGRQMLPGLFSAGGSVSSKPRSTPGFSGSVDDDADEPPR